METIKKETVNVEQVQIDNEAYYRISNVDTMRPFFMSIVSHSNHWMFISSNGGLTAGRKNAEHALFPYYTDDKITESAEITGSKTIIHIQKLYEEFTWEPFSIRFQGKYNVSRNLYKNRYGNKIRFEEINHDLKLKFCYEWNSSDRYGFIKKSIITNFGDDEVHIYVLDGLQNIIPSGVGSYLQSQTSNLVDAYKRNELVKDAGLGIYALSAIIVDKAEPSEALKANIAWSVGCENPIRLLSSLQLGRFRSGMPVQEEIDVKAEKGAYFIHTDMTLAPNIKNQWLIGADVNKTHSQIVEFCNTIIHDQQLTENIQQDIDEGTDSLIRLNASADGLQMSADKFRDTRHFSNVLFNIMRGGIFDNNYQIEKTDFATYLLNANRSVGLECKSILDEMPENISLFELKAIAEKSENYNFKRLCQEYLPLKFSRRHGDPSRPWNRFSINTRSEVDGSKILDYEGNWRDIFQNWEALAHSYPEFIESMIHKFLNATTFDGYNPYRVTKDGIDWETIEADDPWSYIGYWGDHQIIYLLKFLEFFENLSPGALGDLFEENVFVYANVPYVIKSYEDILANPKDTISFNHELNEIIRKQKDVVGADGALLQEESGAIYYVNFIEKMLATVLSKLSNFIPEGGIWMNTQRPEWNDANNALVGNGVSMVTLYYLRRFLTFFKDILSVSDVESVKVSNELVDFYRRLRSTFETHATLLTRGINDLERKTIVDELGLAGSAYRQHIYKQGFWGRKRSITVTGIVSFIDNALKFLDHAIEANRRSDQLFHAYNIMMVTSDKEISISHLSEMLEGQVAVLSAGYLSAEESLQLLDALKDSQLFRPDQYSYLLYPNKDLPGFMERNNIHIKSISQSRLLMKMSERNDLRLVEKDIHGGYHFNGNFKNSNDLKDALDALSSVEEYADLVKDDYRLILDIYEEVFNHKAFTGRSGTFFGYEGLGSIYWHMVSKLQLAVQECCLRAMDQQTDAEIVGRLLDHYYEINAGIGVHKSPELYGAFPTDPYSHTPAGKGAQQPGMTGQVKEDILCRIGELGVSINNGVICFKPRLLKASEFINYPTVFHYVDVHANNCEVQLEKESLAFTICQVPVIYIISDQTKIIIQLNNGEAVEYATTCINDSLSMEISKRTGIVKQIKFYIKKGDLK